MNFETKINQYIFRYVGDDTIEVYHSQDKQRNPLRIIKASGLDTKKKFEQECGYWFMENGSTL